MHWMTVLRRLRTVILVVCLVSVGFLLPDSAAAQEDQQMDEFHVGRVLEVIEEGVEDLGGGYSQPFRTMRVELLGKGGNGEEMVLTQYGETVDAKGGEMEPGDKIVVGKGPTADGEGWFVLDNYRLPAAAFIAFLFLALAVLFGRLRGLTATAGLLFSVAVLALYVVPGIIDGNNPLVVSLIGSVVIAVFSLFMAHGINRRTSIALMATLATLGIAALLAVVFVSLARLTGLGSESAFYLRIGHGQINLQGLLLGGIILGALGVLDDITTTQVAAVSEISKADPSLGWRELYRRGNAVGVEHIASMINTLALAYMGAALPLFLLFSLHKYQPFWVVLNSQIIMEEVVRTLVGSAALICAVPISTLAAAYLLSKADVRHD
jgi:uncharacterized membrane protein